MVLPGRDSSFFLFSAIVQVGKAYEKVSCYANFKDRLPKVVIFKDLVHLIFTHSKLIGHKSQFIHTFVFSFAFRC